MKRIILITLAMISTRAYADTPPEPMPPTGDSMEEIHDAESNAAEGRTNTLNGLNDQANFWAEHGVSLINATLDFAEAFRALTDPDANCMDLGDVGAPNVPTSCAGSDECGQCFTGAQNRLNGMRVNLERLRCVYKATKAFTDASIAFGDSASGIHAVTGLAWQTERRGIQEAFDHFKGSYREKYSQMMPNLRGALEAMGQCESQYFHNNDWYDRFGFIYYTFMADRYKLND